ncbi:hypothetical protein AB0E83_27600 [Streptomyces sp. NPDC035033]|uniref:hypothetical protein n=1 Tax=Streptomyces sp. NPDC035033 TaxID=3155368 RepID=UPI0033E1F67A
MRTLDEIVAEADPWAREHPWRSWVQGWCYRARWCWVQLKREPRHRWEQARRGFSRMDVWGFDHYIAGVIAGGGSCDQLRIGHGHPSDMTAEEWEAFLEGIAVELRRYADPDNFLDADAHAADIAATHRFADRFGDMWDRSGEVTSG